MKELSDNALTLARELAWLAVLIEAALRRHFGHEGGLGDSPAMPPPDLAEDPSGYARTVQGLSLDFAERLVLVLALAPPLRPQVLDPFLLKNPATGLGYAEFGGAPESGQPGFRPTLETAAFILAGSDLERRLELQKRFEPDHALIRDRVLEMGDGPGGPFGMPLRVGRDYWGRLTTGARHRPAFGGGFPAKRIDTPLSWDDLVLGEYTLDDVEEIRAWIEHRHTLLHDWQLSHKIKPGFRSLFYGPPGTGKTLTASLLGKSTGLDVYRVDLSLVVSKWVGETEKNLAGVFDQAERHDWILFFDEADALFGKRTQTSSANDRYANQEVAYLLQRVEDFPGVVILASNLKGNMDEAFARRFQSMIYFPMPGPEERRRLWRNAFSKKTPLEPAVDLEGVAREYEVTGGAIINVVRYASLMALRRGTDTILLQDIRPGIRREVRKAGTVI
ncbi:ATP-binding protein [Methylomagnum sp.]